MVPSPLFLIPLLIAFVCALAGPAFVIISFCVKKPNRQVLFSFTGAILCAASAFLYCVLLVCGFPWHPFVYVPIAGIVAAFGAALRAAISN